MASITKLGKGKQPPRAIDFVDSNDGRKRKRIRLGVVGLSQAREAKVRVEKLLSAKVLNQTPDAETLRWLADVGDTIHGRFVRAGLAEPRQPVPTSPQLGDFLAKHLEQRKAEIAPSSIERLRQTADKVSAYFGPELRLDQITADGAKDWRASMLTDGLAEATVRLHCRNVKSTFNDAVERELIGRSPFAALKSAAIAADRDHYVTATDAAKILDACPNMQWRTLFGLMRFAGLRCPSETHNVTWRDVDWDRRRLTVYAPKTKRTRIVPIVATLWPMLQDAFDAAAECSDRIITLSRNNRHRTFHDILRKAGQVAWPDLFQTLRRSCETDLARTCPQHAVSAWIGHSMKVSERYYLQLTDDLYDLASGIAAESAAVGHGIASQQAAKAEEPSKGQNEKAPQMPLVATNCEAMLSEADGNRTRNHRIDRSLRDLATTLYLWGLRRRRRQLCQICESRRYRSRRDVISAD